MKITPVYGNQIINVPAAEVCRRLSTATREELAVLLSVLAAPDVEIPDRAAALNLTEKAFRDALSVWQRCGVLTLSPDTENVAAAKGAPGNFKASTGRVHARFAGSVSEEPLKPESIQITPSGGVKRVHTRRELPQYGAENAAAYLETHEDVRNLVDCCQNVTGDMFSSAETEIVIGLHDYLALSPEYILLLFAHAKRMGKRSVRYVEKLAIQYFDDGILTYQELEDRLRRVEQVNDVENYVRSLFGLRTRALVPDEKKMIETWIADFHFSKEIIQRAYEVTISNIQKPSLSYANAILRNWHEGGLHTLEEVNTALAEYRKAKEQQPDGSSFNTDDFFQAALRQSYTAENPKEPQNAHA